MQIYKSADLVLHHTFSISQTSQYIVEIESIEDLKSVYLKEEWKALPKLMLGKGSNVLFVEPFEGVAIVNRLQGIEVNETEADWKLHINAGEDWPSLVEWAVNKGIGGLENLAMIPGCVGSAPIQNIGAYGVELCDVCEYVDYLCLESMKVKRLSKGQCQFGYRDSIFKHELYQKSIIVSVGLTLTKSWAANTKYGPLQELISSEITPKTVYSKVCEVRSSKLPDPNVVGNAGSFFKNPIVPQLQFEKLQQKFPSIVAYPADKGMKLAAGWLIDQCGLKGYQIGGAQVHEKQALVIINKDNATSQDIVDLAAYVRQSVLDKFAVELEHEVRFIGRSGETSLKQLLGDKL
ncbi:UDP-N-acetylmuramate dehydrogenase [Vibrio marisflavi]|uniref:UDP-N-acetylenolpyruvoylglucosamine reductase n=1 Tax=Vibrio marisflavi CECT 7928 TaxID=634439 RepID=A0ABM9A7Y2_9VIBR|nr:UDP-N-acetylmuramate dehydrogenase [Vibrio marisflavi]CAH0541742.1 UDP-N-acetylenolpyruvoylglucosamine reductase [Vibrio marisflavi CECT 7928]